MLNVDHNGKIYTVEDHIISNSVNFVLYKYSIVQYFIIQCIIDPFVYISLFIFIKL